VQISLISLYFYLSCALSNVNSRFYEMNIFIEITQFFEIEYNHLMYRCPTLICKILTCEYSENLGEVAENCTLLGLISCDVYACMFVCMYVFMFVCLYICMYVCLYVCMYVCMYGCAVVWLYVWLYVCEYVCMYACMHAHEYVRM